VAGSAARKTVIPQSLALHFGFEIRASGEPDPLKFELTIQLNSKQRRDNVIRLKEATAANFLAGEKRGGLSEKRWQVALATFNLNVRNGLSGSP